MKIEINKLTFPNGKTIEFDFEVSKYLYWGDDIVIVILKYPLKEVYNRNIFGFDIEGNKLWQIEDLFNHGDCPYVDVVEYENNLLASNWCGFRIKLNPKSGKVLEKTYTK